MRALALIAACLLATPAGAQVLNPPTIPAAPAVDTSAFATKTEAQAAKTAADTAAANAAAADAKAVAAKTAADAAKAAADATAAAMPLPSTAVPLAEQVTPAVGTSTRYRRMDDIQPRITRAKSCTLVSGGTCSVTYEALAATDPNVIAFAINAGTQPIICGPSATATTTTATIKCFITQPTTLPSLATSLLGLLIPVTVTAPAGTVVQVTLLPKN